MEPISDPLRAACAGRRAQLAARLGEVAAVIPAGRPAPRNYPANIQWPWRASSHFLYLVGVPIEGATLVIHRGESTLCVPTADAEDALWHGPAEPPGILAQRLGLGIAPAAALGELLGGRRRGLLAPPDPASQAELAALGPFEDSATVADAMIALRLVHDAAAIEQLEIAAAATVEAHRAGMAATRPGRPAFEIVGALLAPLLARGLWVSYPPIVTPRGEVLHNHAHHDVLAAGDLLLADVGAETRGGFAGDVTRTWPVSGKFSKSQQALYEVVLATQAACIAQARPGTRFRDLHLRAARTLSQGLKDLGILRGEVDGLVEDDVHACFFPHGLGHLIGLDVHDMEDLGDRAGYAPGRTRSPRFGLGALRLDRDLAPGMAVTIEPGFYQVPAILEDPARRAAVGDRIVWSRLADFADVRGIRIEDDVLITTEGPRVLTAAAPKSVAEIEAVVGRADPPLNR